MPCRIAALYMTKNIKKKKKKAVSTGANGNYPSTTVGGNRSVYYY